MSVAVRAAAAVVLAAALFAVARPAHGVGGDDYGTSEASDPDYVAGKAAIERKDWPEAVAQLLRAEVRFPDSAEVHNYLGYAYRQLGRFELAFRHYERAIAIDPRHRGAHEYIGEAYLMVGDLPGAEKHVAALRAICLLPCEELDDLEKAVAKYRTSGGSVPAARR